MAKNKKKHIVGKMILIVIVLALVVGFACRGMIFKAVEKKAAKVIAEKLIDEQMSLDTSILGDKTAQDIIDSMDKEDQEEMIDVIVDNMTDENIDAAKEYVADGDVSGLKEYAKNNLSEEDKETVKVLYEKYKNEIVQ